MITVGRLQVTPRWRVVAHACHIATQRTLGLGLWGWGLVWLVISPSTGLLLLTLGTLVQRQTRSWRRPRSAAVQALFYP